MRLSVAGVYVASFVFHAGLAAVVSAIDPPEVIETVRITLREPPPEVTEPEEAPPPPEPEAPPPPVAEAAPPPRPRPEAPPPTPQAAAPIPELGVAMQGGVGLGGVAVPIGSPVAPPPQVTRTATRTLEAPPEPQRQASDGCAEEATRPRPLEMPQPAYTDEARAAAIEGRVRVRIEVDESGAVASVDVLEGLGHGLDEAAVAAVRGARFEPAMRCGRAAAASFTIAVRFTL